jgi:DNA-binding transcriptional ArsR family regulator
MTATANAAHVFKSLGDDTRLDIVRKLARDESEVNSKEIVSSCSIALKLSQPTLSHHFHTLVASGVLLERKVGVEKYYRLNQPLLKQLGIDAEKL